MPILYAAGADTRHVVRVAATFAAGVSDELPKGPQAADRQVVVFYTVPPDLFHDMSRSVALFQPLTDHADEIERRRWSASWQLDESYRAIDIFSEPFQTAPCTPSSSADSRWRRAAA